MRFTLCGVHYWESATSLFGQALETGFVLIGREVSVAETKFSKPVDRNKYDCGSTIISGPLILPQAKSCSIYDIAGRTIMPEKLKPGIYFIEVDGKIVKKIIKIN